MNGELFGDYELLIDECLDGCPHLKQKVAVADKRNRGGLAILLNALHNRRVKLTPFQTRLVQQLKAVPRVLDVEAVRPEEHLS
jgi:aminoglycoside phosphotransferase